MRKAYQTDLSDAEWSCLQAHRPPHVTLPASGTGRYQRMLIETMRFPYRGHPYSSPCIESRGPIP
jgi:hypothetical protein